MVLSGFALGVLYFLGLWLTLRDLPLKKRLGVKLVLSFFVRAALLAAAFYYLMGHDWRRMVALVAGFWLARLMMIRRVKTNLQKSGMEPT